MKTMAAQRRTERLNDEEPFVVQAKFLYATKIGRMLVRNTTIAVFAVAMLLAVGMTACGEKPPAKQASHTGKSAGKAVNDAAKATGEDVNDAAKITGNAVEDAAGVTGEYLSKSKDASVRAAQDTLDGIEKKWQDLQTKVVPVTAEAKADLQKAKDQMSQILADARTKLVGAKDASAGAWQQDVKPALDAAVHKAKKLYEEATAKFGGK